jgi:hypothetical protein
MKYKDPADIPVSPGGEIEDEAFDGRSSGKAEAKKV